MSAQNREKTRLALELIVLTATLANTWFTSSVDMKLAQLELRIERRITELVFRHDVKTESTAAVR